MSKQQEQDSYESGEILYQGNAVPKILRIVYIVFSLWAIGYFVNYCFPDLMNWFK